MANPLKFYQTLNQAPRSAKHHGKHRGAGAPAHGHTVVGTDYGTGGSDQGGAVTVALSGWNSFTTFGSAFFTFPEPEPPKPPTIPYAGIRTGEIIGHRLWWVIGSDLCSLAHRRLWKPGETISGDIEEAVVHDAQFVTQTIWGGTYAYAEAAQLSQEIERQRANISVWNQYQHFSVMGAGNQWLPYEETSTFVCGTIKMWGEVIEHQTGYRAQFAKLNSINAIYGDGDLFSLQSKYGVLPTGCDP